jgi:hypothetical protein
MSESGPDIEDMSESEVLQNGSVCDREELSGAASMTEAKTSGVGRAKCEDFITSNLPRSMRIDQLFGWLSE